ncbi:hypothetical protein CH380_08715 [Leptospira adleri]|uniref:Uncharacterized protein n=1 Tax=Leptospira adleri TaxID=2023186 RepID=A0A2M9YQ43_9LEPT|nr:hypothetical protein CH380_08715 [Leptospira adleri]PJZ61196.1 hypothetical protein CH376_14325 [Leptospira adleri]
MVLVFGFFKHPNFCRDRDFKARIFVFLEHSFPFYGVEKTLLLPQSERIFLKRFVGARSSFYDKAIHRLISSFAGRFF